FLGQTEPLSERQRQRLVRAARQHGKAVLAAPVFDTIKLEQDGYVRETLDREQHRWPRAWACLDQLAPNAPPGEWCQTTPRQPGGGEVYAGKRDCRETGQGNRAANGFGATLPEADWFVGAAVVEAEE
ncbi:MAG: 2-C-methyl-D-erythritol 4-phosphate cytidylyltransferase, partial [Chloroflexota bacterium]|nr:2-C-methyl-D-erythritol 4-phosphate cytidylyltransferase [Chloroflexota bacterium]